MSGTPSIFSTILAPFSAISRDVVALAESTTDAACPENVESSNSNSWTKFIQDTADQALQKLRKQPTVQKLEKAYSNPEVQQAAWRHLIKTNVHQAVEEAIDLFNQPVDERPSFHFWSYAPKAKVVAAQALLTKHASLFSAEERDLMVLEISHALALLVPGGPWGSDQSIAALKKVGSWLSEGQREDPRFRRILDHAKIHLRKICVLRGKRWEAVDPERTGAPMSWTSWVAGVPDLIAQQWKSAEAQLKLWQENPPLLESERLRIHFRQTMEQVDRHGVDSIVELYLNPERAHSSSSWEKEARAAVEEGLQLVQAQSLNPLFTAEELEEMQAHLELAQALLGPRPFKALAEVQGRLSHTAPHSSAARKCYDWAWEIFDRIGIARRYHGHASSLADLAREPLEWLEASDLKPPTSNRDPLKTDAFSWLNQCLSDPECRDRAIPWFYRKAVRSAQHWAQRSDVSQPTEPLRDIETALEILNSNPDQDRDTAYGMIWNLQRLKSWLRVEPFRTKIVEGAAQLTEPASATDDQLRGKVEAAIAEAVRETLFLFHLPLEQRPGSVEGWHRAPRGKVLAAQELLGQYRRLFQDNELALLELELKRALALLGPDTLVGNRESMDALARLGEGLSESQRGDPYVLRVLLDAQIQHQELGRRCEAKVVTEEDAELCLDDATEVDLLSQEKSAALDSRFETLATILAAQERYNPYHAYLARQTLREALLPFTQPRSAIQLVGAPIVLQEESYDQEAVRALLDEYLEMAVGLCPDVAAMLLQVIAEYCVLEIKNVEIVKDYGVPALIRLLRDYPKTQAASFIQANPRLQPLVRQMLVGGQAPQALTPEDLIVQDWRQGLRVYFHEGINPPPERKFTWIFLTMGILVLANYETGGLASLGAATDSVVSSISGSVIIGSLTVDTFVSARNKSHEAEIASILPIGRIDDRQNDANWALFVETASFASFFGGRFLVGESPFLLRLAGGSVTSMRGLALMTLTSLPIIYAFTEILSPRPPDTSGWRLGGIAAASLGPPAFRRLFPASLYSGLYLGASRENVYRTLSFGWGFLGIWGAAHLLGEPYPFTTTTQGFYCKDLCDEAIVYTGGWPPTPSREAVLKKRRQFWARRWGQVAKLRIR